MDTTGAVSRARIQRRTLTPPEARVWTALKGRALGGFKFRRQHPIGAFVLDFYCAEAKLAVEIDGQGHDQEDAIAHDRRRSAWLAAQGVDVIRFAAEEVRVNPDGVLKAILLAVRARAKSPSTASRSPSPLRSARGEET
ncbi:endonuclease domain-containing protein [Brevundimonas sp.]|uniref:endonuclease domain-containing protein n=1 Tax=Brevundimonas sp. TaxID=1871086 RepID=UPI002E100B39|nr:endonuclease domain-containing protein [Brevundimonas sp.]